MPSGCRTFCPITLRTRMSNPHSIGSNGGGTLRRQWREADFVIARLMEKGFTESKARLALELAILLIKKGQD
jgi:hypothetical protein